mmetsp:Transcript_32313/g.73877  ORF Transcript_32313/g.73877 Transcript_32313/m.73877 type:complete len:204 (-) Transcript_32313:449-1060(-)
MRTIELGHRQVTISLHEVLRAKDKGLQRTITEGLPQVLTGLPMLLQPTFLNQCLLTKRVIRHVAIQLSVDFVNGVVIKAESVTNSVCDPKIPNLQRGRREDTLCKSLSQTLGVRTGLACRFREPVRRPFIQSPLHPWPRRRHEHPACGLRFEGERLLLLSPCFHSSFVSCPSWSDSLRQSIHRDRGGLEGSYDRQAYGNNQVQ